MKFKKINNFINYIQNSPDIEAIADDKNVGLLLEIMLPVFSSIIKTYAFEPIKEKRLNKRFEEIEEILPETLTKDDGVQLIELIEHNSNMLWTALANFQDLLNEHNDLKKTISSYIAIPSNQAKVFKPSDKFKFVVIAGASGVGKDVQLELLKINDFKKYRHTDVLKKYSTRKPRNNDSDYYNFISEHKFNKLKENGKILFPYVKRDYQYGFDKNQFVNEAKGNVLLFTIFTEFEMAKDAKNFLTEQGIKTQFILLNAPLKDLRFRAAHRNFSIDEVKRRLTSIEQDINYINNHKEMLSEIYDFIDVSNDRSVNDINKELIALIDK